jgi:hypothetical protein
MAAGKEAGKKDALHWCVSILRRLDFPPQSIHLNPTQIGPSSAARKVGYNTKLVHQILVETAQGSCEDSIALISLQQEKMA